MAILKPPLLEKVGCIRNVSTWMLTFNFWFLYWISFLFEIPFLVVCNYWYCQKWPYAAHKVVSKLCQSCVKVASKLCQTCVKLVSKLSHSYPERPTCAKVFSMQFSSGAKCSSICQKWCPSFVHVVPKRWQVVSISIYVTSCWVRAFDIAAVAVMPLYIMLLLRRVKKWLGWWWVTNS